MKYSVSLVSQFDLVISFYLEYIYWMDSNSEVILV